MTDTILVVEDKDSNYHLLEQFLSRQNYDVIRARDGAEGLALAAEVHPQLVLLDLRLPQVDGWQMATQMKADAGLRDIPIIALSVEVEPMDRQRALNAGCDEYIAKPFKIAELKNMIEHFL